jgi:hypothetical protein
VCIRSSVTFVVRSGRESFALVSWSEERSAGAIAVRDPFVARALLARFAGSGENMATLRRAFAGERPAWALARLSDDEILEALAQRLVAGRLRLVRLPAPRLVVLDIGREEEPARAPAPPPEIMTSWIESELVDHDDRPVAAEPYEVVGADGASRTGQLDGRGFARVLGLAPGTARVRFSGRDRLDWHPVVPRAADDPGARSGEATTWIEIELRDDDDRPVAGERYQVVDRGGRRLSGTLDGVGFARVEPVLSGVCRVSFPDRESGDWARA